MKTNEFQKYQSSFRLEFGIQGESKQVMTNQTTKLPLWIRIVTGLFAIMEIAVSLSIWFSPESVLETVDLKAKGVDYLFQMWAVRQFALGFILGFATWKNSPPMMTVSYMFFLVMFLGDLLIGVVQNEISLIISASVMCLVSVAMLLSITFRK